MAKKVVNKKQSGRSTGGGGGDNEAKREQPLQAVLLAGDSFTTDHFRPLSLDRPKALCPLNNVALIDYAMDYLAGAGVEELFVVCASEQVEQHVEQHQSVAPIVNSMQISVIKDTFFNNAGDALRELDKRNLIHSDPFLLMFGDVITNVDLTAAIQAHKERHRKDSTAIMTLVFKEIGATCVKSSIRSNMEDLVLGIDPTHENRILFYDCDGATKTAALPCSFFTTNPEIEVRSDLLDCGIDICSPDVLARFSDNFDYGDIRTEFVANSVAEEEEGLQNRIFAHILQSQDRPNEYAARVHDFYVYATVSRDLLRRWCYPVVPDHYNNDEKHCRYTMQRHYLYVETKNGRTRVKRHSTVRGPGMLGTSCLIGENCKVDGSVFGNQCHIENGSVVKGCHLWDGVLIEEGATVIQSILADGVVVKKGAFIDRGCIIGAGCVVGKNVNLPPFTRLTLREEEEEDFGDDWGDDDEDDDEEEEDDESGNSDEDENDKQPKKEKEEKKAFVSDVDVVGPDGKGRVWKPRPEDDDAYGAEGSGFWSLQEQMCAQSIGYDVCTMQNKRSQYQKEQDDNFSLADDVADELAENFEEDYGEVTFSADAPGSYKVAEPIVGRQKGVDVIKELTAICLEYELTSPIENLAIELNSFKFSQNATYSDCTIAATVAILERMNITKDITDGKLVSLFKSSLEHWAPLLQKMSVSAEEEKAMVLALERCAIEDNEMGHVLSTGMSFRFLLQTLHDEEIVGEDAILAWAEERKDEGDTPRGRLVRLQPVLDFIEWLQEDNGDGDDSEEDDSDASNEDDHDEDDESESEAHEPVVRPRVVDV